MSHIIFYSWQSTLPETYNRFFIRDCIKEAIRQLKREIGDQSDNIYLDRGTEDLPGTPNVPTALHEKIRESDIFIADETFVAYSKKPNPHRSWLDKKLGINKSINEGIPNPNVIEETGIAKGDYRGYARIIKVMNIKYGNPSQLYFDSVQDRFAITYNYSEKTNPEEKKQIKKDLIDKLKYSVGLVIETELERQKNYYRPFDTWGSWATHIDRTTLKFELTVFISEIFSTINNSINIHKSVFRMNGLSGIGKTRILFEFFVNQETGAPIILANKVLYVNMNDADEKDIKNKIRDFLQKNENKILIVDNCSKELHSEISKYVAHENSRLSLITVGGDPEERLSEIDDGGSTQMIKLDNENNKATVAQILANNFSNELQPDELKLLIDFSSGLPFIATLMANNQDRAKYEPGTLTREEIVKRLLGQFYSDKIHRAVVYACCLFSKFGFSDELIYQSEKIALNDDLFNVNPEHVKAEDIDAWKIKKFSEVCAALSQRQLLEKRGRTYSFRPSPLAVRMAEDWWRECTMNKFNRLVPFLNEQNLIEPFCEQFRYLRHVENARTIVQRLCANFFSYAEVLNTSVGSRLFRSFVYVNPIACTSALFQAFSALSKDDVIIIREGRRNLVWALEKLCYRKDTFYQATRVMAILAIGENENLGNNATNQFIQLFHIHLPGTQADLNSRWEIIQDCLDKNLDFQSLAINAIASALTVANFHRMGGAEDQGDIDQMSNGPGDYQPSSKEIFEYWNNVINALEQIALQPGDFQNRAISIIKDRFYGLCSFGAANMIIPVIKQLLKAGLYERMELRAKLQFILNSQRIYDRKALEDLQQMFDELVPSDFAEQFQILVTSPTFEEYDNGDNSGQHGEKLHKKIEKLTQTFIELKPKWEELFQILMAPSLAEGYTFGKYLSLNASESDLTIFLNYMIQNLVVTVPENRNASILMGIVANHDNIEFTKSIFYKVLEIPSINELSFTIARSSQLRFEEINELLNKSRSGIFPTAYFREFNYGWGLKHLQKNQVEILIEKLRSIDDVGKAVAFFILATWTMNNEAEFELFKPFLRKILLEDSNVIFSHLTNSMDIHYYEKIIIKLLALDPDDALAKTVIELIVRESNELQYFYFKDTSFYNILNILQEKYFQNLWESITQVYINLESYGTSAWHFKNLLGGRHDYNSQSIGLLFGGNPDKFDMIFKWCKEHPERELLWITELLPIFSSKRSEQNEWHPYAMKFIDEFGKDKHFLGALSAKINTYSWAGSIIPKLISDKALFERLLNHPYLSVREWAQYNIEDIDKRIKFENDRNEEGV